MLSVSRASARPGWPVRRATVARLDEEPRRALARELDQTLGEWADDDDGLVFPMQTWLATARR